MERLKQLILGSEDEIVHGVAERTSALGYGQRMPALEEAYRLETATLSANFVQALELEGDIGPLAAANDIRQDPVAAVGSRLARASGTAAPSAALLLGLIKCYRSTYLDVVSAAGLPRAESQDAIRAIGRFFDRVEIGVIAAKASGETEQVTIVDRHSSLVDERNRYLAAFSSLPLPALFIDSAGRVEHINAASSLLFGSPTETHSRYFQDPADRLPPPVLGREIDEFRDESSFEKSFETELKTGKGTRYFQVRFTKTPAADGSFSGILVVLNDLTYRRNAEEALRRSQTQYAALFEHMPIGFVHTRVLLDRRNRAADHTVLEVNPAFEAMCGACASALVGKSFTDVLRLAGANGLEWMDVLGRAALTGEVASFDAVLGASGEWVSVSAFSPAPGHVALMLSDITGVKEVEQSLARSRDSYLTLLEGIPSLVWRAGADGGMDFVNTAWLEFTGLPAASGTGEWDEAVHPDDRERRNRALHEAAADRTEVEIEYRLRHSDGEYRWMRESGRPFEGLDGRFAGLIGTTADVSDQRERDQTLERMATSDALTGLPNGKVFEESLTRAIGQSQRGRAAALMLADIDGFALLNEKLGHEEADAVLTQSAHLMRGLVRSGDLIARVGADSFAVLLQTATLDDAERAARRFLDAMRAAGGRGEAAPVTISIGLVVVGGGVTSTELLTGAESAVMSARDAGGDRFAVGGSQGPAVYAHDSGASEAVRDALADDGLLLHYQPAFRVRDGVVEFTEALVRLRAPGEVVLEPGGFLPDAERTGLMPRLTRRIVRVAIADLARRPGAVVAVNISASNLRDPELLEEAAAWATEAGVSVERLGFEVPEEDAVRDLEAARRWIEGARERGFGVALDHVGRGSRSFAHLQDLPVDRLTIDGSVVSGIDRDARQVSLLESIQMMAGALGMRTVAQWVEDERTLCAVRDAGVDLVQGFHLRPPAAPLDVSSEPAWSSKFQRPSGRGM